MIINDGKYLLVDSIRKTNQEVLYEKGAQRDHQDFSTWLKNYPIVFLDGVVIKIRRGNVEGEVVYIALGINEDGYKEVLGFWIMGAEGGEFRYLEGNPLGA